MVNLLSMVTCQPRAHSDDYDSSSTTTTTTSVESLSKTGKGCEGGELEISVSGYRKSVSYCCPETGVLPVFRLNNVFVSPCGKMFDLQNFYALAGCPPDDRRFEMKLGTPVILHQKAINLIHCKSFNYYHTMIEVLPTMWRMREVVQNQRDIPILVTDTVKLDNLLTFLQWKREDLGEFVMYLYNRTNPLSFLLLVETLYSAGRDLCSTPVLADWRELRDRFFQVTIPAVTGSKPPRTARELYIVLVNRLAVNRSLPQLGTLKTRLEKQFGASRVTVFNGTESLAEMLEIFSKATLILGAHGSGLANMIFAPDNCVVVEIYPNGIHDPHYLNLAPAVGLEYHRILSNGTRETALFTDLDEVMGVLNQATHKHLEAYKNNT